MKRYEYKALSARVNIAMSANDFGNWVFEKLNEWGADGWLITSFQTPAAPPRPGGQPALTGELLATGVREIWPEVDDREMPFDSGKIVDMPGSPVAPPVIGG